MHPTFDVEGFDQIEARCAQVSNHWLGANCFLWWRMALLPGISTLWRSMMSKASATIFVEPPLWCQTLRGCNGAAEALTTRCPTTVKTQSPMSTQTLPWTLTFPSGGPLCSPLLACPSTALGGKRGSTEASSSAGQQETHAKRERKRRSRTPARPPPPPDDDPPLVAASHKSVGALTDRIIEEATAIAVKVLGRNPVIYELCVQDVVDEAYATNAGIITPAIVEKMLFQGLQA